MKSPDDKYKIHGRVIDTKSSRGIAGLRVEAWDKDLLLNDLVGTDKTDTDGRFQIEFTTSYLSELFLDRRPDLFFKVFDNGELIKSTQDSVMWNVSSAATPVEISVPWTSTDAPPRGVQENGSGYTVSGVVSSPDRAGLNGLRVQIIDKNIAGDLLVAETVTDADGRYSVNFAATAVKQSPDLQARVFSGADFLAESEVRYDASNQETLNITLPANASALPTEYEALLTAITTFYNGRLGDLEETSTKHDITYLANKTGWDARAVALAALADQFSRSTPLGVPLIAPAFYYALFRAGLAANPNLLYQTDSQTVAQIWNQAINQAVIPDMLSDDIPAALKAFESLGAQSLLNGVPVTGVSSLPDVLAVSQLNDAEQKQFAELYTAHRNDLPTFWTAIREQFGTATMADLQLNGKLGFLTLNNAPLMQGIHSAVGGRLGDPSELVQHGFYRAELWQQLLDTQKMPVPTEIPGDTVEETRANYAEFLAAQVRLSYPTASVAEIVKTEMPAAHTFLTDHRNTFEIGALPVEQYVAQNNVQVDDQTLNDVKRLQRVYQITPSDQAMTGLIKSGIDSAYKVVQHDKNQFVQEFAQELGGTEIATRIYDRSVHIHNAVLNVAVSYLTARNGIALGAVPLTSPQNGSNNTQLLTPMPQRNGDGTTDLQRAAAPNATDVLAYSSLETLLGATDFCACDHCRSIFSPAAYLVDLLNFIDSATTEQGKSNPQTVLFDRRPDIQHLPLTCENTNTALPYIDVVNETLEYFIANKKRQFSLTDYTGHDTGGAASEDLLASPQSFNEKVRDDAYNELRVGRFPPPLPFHQPLENLRRYFAKFEVPLPLAMERLRKTDVLERTTNTYGWRDILLEELHVSLPEDLFLRTSLSSPEILSEIYGFPLDMVDADAIKILSNAKVFARRLEITYDDLIAILKTRFINPNSTLLPKLERLGVPFATLIAFKNDQSQNANQSFTALLPKAPLAPDPSEYDGNIPNWVKQQDNFNRIMGIITLTVPLETWSASKSYSPGICVRPTSPPPGSTLYYECTKAGTSGGTEPNPWPAITGGTHTDGSVTWKCRDLATPASFENVGFRYPDGKLLGVPEFVRLLRFVRLWKKLGWTIEQTDAAICALFPVPPFPQSANAANDIFKLNRGFSTLLPSLGVIVRVMKELDLTTDRDLLPLLTCWAPLDTHGPNALYRQMFLNPTVLGQDAVFADNGYGEFLKGSNDTVSNHAEALRAAFNLSADEFALITASLSSQTLTIENISAIYRRGWLARKLEISVRELLLLSQVTGIDPFVTINPVDPAILKLIALVKAIRAQGLEPAAGLYLIWNHDLTSRAAPEFANIAACARALRSGFAAINAEFDVKDDADGTMAQRKMAMVYGKDTTDFFFGLLNNTLTTDTGPFFARFPELKTAYENYVSSNAAQDEKWRTLLAEILSQLIKRRKEQHALETTSAAASTTLDFAQALLNAAFTPYPLHALRTDSRPGLNDMVALETEGLSMLTFGGPAVEEPQSTSIFLPDSASTSGDLRAEPTAVWSGYLEAPDSGFLKVTITTAAAGASASLKRVSTETDTSVSLKLENNDVKLVSMPVVLPDGNSGVVWTNADAIELRAGSFYAVQLTVKNFERLRSFEWELQPKGQAKSVITNRYFYPAPQFDDFRQTFLRFFKAATLAASLKLNANEMSHFASYADYLFANANNTRVGWLNILPNSATSDSRLVTPLRDLLDYARIKSELAPASDSLLTVLTKPDALTQTGDRLLLTLMRWDKQSLDDLLKHFFVTADLEHLRHFQNFRRVYDAFALLKLMGISAAKLISAATNDPGANIVRDFQAALRARYDAANWRTIVRPINDEMRGLQRDALVAYILHQMRSDQSTSHIDTPEKLFEYFLMDVQMEPCMQTSRIRHALSSVQLFIERCLMNLESRVSPASIDASQWQWMKRYRVWEANRKVFLFPENWLEPELRDNKSPFFKEIESELLQSDITEDSATTALLNYLAKLDEVSKLEPCGIYCVEGDLSKQTDDVYHVVARTAGANRKYFYRRREHGYWTPWEQIKLDIEDNPVIPVVWKGRLLLFWLRILKQAPASVGTLPVSSSQGGSLSNVTLGQIKQDAKTNAQTTTAITVQAVLCWSEYFNGKWQPTKTSDVNNPATLDWFPIDGQNAFDRAQVTLSISHTPEEIFVSVHYLKLKTPKTTFKLYNTHSLPQPARLVISYNHEDVRVLDVRTAANNSGPLMNTYFRGFTTIGFLAGWDDKLDLTLLTAPSQFKLVEACSPSQAPFEAPFFFEDSRHVFLVKTAEQRVTLPNYIDPGFFIQAGQMATHIPPLVLGNSMNVGVTSPLLRDSAGTGLGVSNPGAIQHLISEDAQIQNAIGSTGMVNYGGSTIGPLGSFINLSKGK